MDQKSQPVILYTAQTAPVLEAIRRDGVCFSRECYIREKYQENSQIFLTIYRQFVREASKIVPPPEGAELPYWAFENPYNMYVGTDASVLKLAVPRDQVILFDLYDWNKILQFRYLGTSDAENKAFQRELDLRGITTWDVMRTNFYPELRQQILDSWKSVLRHHDALLSGDKTGVGSVQAALWQIRKEWIIEVKE